MALDAGSADRANARSQTRSPRRRCLRGNFAAAFSPSDRAVTHEAALPRCGGLEPVTFEPTADLGGFALRGRDERLVLFPPIAPPPAIPLYAEATLDAAIVARHHRPLMPPEVAVYALTGFRLGSTGLLARGERFFHREDCLPNYFLGWLTPFPHNLPGDFGGSLDLPAAEVIRLDQPLAVAFHPNLVWGHFLVEVLPRLFLVNLLGRMGRRIPLAAPAEAPDWAKRFAVTYGGPGGVLWYEPKRQMVTAPAFVVPGMMQVDWVLHPIFNLLVSDLIARCGLAEDVVPDGPRRLYLSRARFWGAKRLLNEPEVEEMLRGLGFAVVHPETLSFPDQMRLFRAAEVIVAEYGSVLHNALFARPGTRVVAINRHNWLQGEIARIRRQFLAYVPPSDGVWRDPSTPEEARNFTVDIAKLRQTVQAVLEEMAMQHRVPMSR
jgi:capsular polysaccharide biosynthesis protein